jgi:hypothetical protein
LILLPRLIVVPKKLRDLGARDLRTPSSTIQVEAVLPGRAADVLFESVPHIVDAAPGIVEHREVGSALPAASLTHR